MSDITAFDSLDLKPALLGNLADIGHIEMTPVQAHALPKMLAGADVLACAKTGSGKTAAFGLGLLNKLNVASFQVQALVLCPTRELADQVTRELRRLAQAIPNIKILSLCGGAPLGPQYASLQHSPHVIVGTPGRVLKHLKERTVDLGELHTFVLDEADRLLDMGFTEELDAILAFVPDNRQTLLFSATYPDAIASMSARVQRDPVHVDVTAAEPPARISQYWCEVTRENRNAELLRVLRAWGGGLNLIFCNTRVDCAEVQKYLQAAGLSAIALHGDLDQRQRTRALVRFANRSASILVATDVAARGLDVDNLDTVINYELPPQPEVYIHRIGRTGRAGKQGLAVSLIEAREVPRLREIERLFPRCTLLQKAIPNAGRSADSLSAPMVTIQINGGRRNKLRPGDILGALTAEGGVPGASVGSINIFDAYSYVALRSTDTILAKKHLEKRPIKGRTYVVRILK
jgi:ATP-independent RNA helicase DbpA